jgi:hypothetical protein
VAHGNDDVILANGVAYEGSATAISADAGEHINGANLRSIAWTVEGYLGYSLTQPPAAECAPGEDWVHQRWEECFPRIYYTTVQAGLAPRALSVYNLVV